MNKPLKKRHTSPPHHPHLADSLYNRLPIHAISFTPFLVSVKRRGSPTSFWWNVGLLVVTECTDAASGSDALIDTDCRSYAAKNKCYYISSIGWIVIKTVQTISSGIHDFSFSRSDTYLCTCNQRISSCRIIIYPS